MALLFSFIVKDTEICKVLEACSSAQDRNRVRMGIQASDCSRFTLNKVAQLDKQNKKAEIIFKINMLHFPQTALML